MNIVLLSGGSGKRLWPLSNDVRSKQFLKLLRNENGHAESMIQRVYRQIKEAGINTNTVVTTGKNQVESIRAQLGSTVDIIVEPERRDTFPAVVLSSAYLYYIKEIHPDEPVIFMPVDPYADLEYFKILKTIERLVSANKANIVLMGIKPTYPSAKYGYILPGSHSSEYYMVKGFYEKPSEETAEKLINEGAVWNGGVFAFKIGFILDITRKYINFNTFDDILFSYDCLPKISFDYEVIEKEPSIAMLEYCGIWKDLGTWNTLAEIMKEKTSGNVIIDELSVNTHVLNELNIPVAVLGISNAVVAASPDGILVSDKHQSSYIKKYIDNIADRPMYKERSWGENRVLNFSSFDDGIHSLTSYLTVKANQHTNYQEHQVRDEIWTIINGSGQAVVDGHIHNIGKGDIVYINKGQKHALIANSDLHVIEVQIGEELSDEDLKVHEWCWI